MGHYSNLVEGLTKLRMSIGERIHPPKIPRYSGLWQLPKLLDLDMTAHGSWAALGQT